MAKTRWPERAFTLTMALLFLGTGVATGVAVILSTISQNKQASANNQSSSSNSNSNSSSQGSTKLAGTKLAGFIPVGNVSNLEITDTKAGTGQAATSSSTVDVLYTGAVASTGIIFQASTDSSPSPVSLSLKNVIVGWQKGIPGMKVGGTRRIVIPANEAYGANPPQGSNIPPNAPLVFDITLLGVQQ